MENAKNIRPKISLLDEESYVVSICELGYYFIEKYPKFFTQIRQNDTEQFELWITSKKYDNPFPLNHGLAKDSVFIETVCKTMHVGGNNDKYDLHITIQIVKTHDISISFMHKRAYNDQVEIYFSDHSQKGVELPGQKKEECDPSLLSPSVSKFFINTIGFAGERITTIEKGLNTLESVLQKLEDYL